MVTDVFFWEGTKQSQKLCSDVITAIKDERA